MKATHGTTSEQQSRHMTPPQTAQHDKPPPQSHEARIAALEAAMKHQQTATQEHQQRLDDGSVTMKQMQADLKVTSETTVSIKSDTGEIIDLFQSFKGAFKVFDLIGRLAKPLAAVVALGVTVWGAVQAFASGGHVK